MTDQEILLAMSNMLQPIREDIQEIKVDMVEVKGRLSNVENDMVEVKGRLSNVENDMVEVKGRLSNVENDMVEVKGSIAELSKKVTQIELTQENIIIPRLNTIEACYTSTYNRYKDNVNDYEAMKQDISVLKHVVSEHSRILQKIS